MDQERKYLIPFNVPSEKERILDVIAHHNSESAYTDEFVRYGPEEEYELLRVGQPFTSAVVLDVKPGWAFVSPDDGPALDKAVLVSQAGDRADTATFLRWHLMRAIPDVFCLGMHAVDCYACSKKLRKRYAEEPLERISKKRIGLSKREANGQNGLCIVPRVRPAKWTTRFCATNPEWAAMLHGLDKMERKRRILENPAMVAQLSSYATATKGFLVWDRHFGEDERESAESYAAMAGCA